jgi:hypothetical protein
MDFNDTYDLSNTGTVKTTGADVTWNSTLTNNGAYISDPGHNNLVVTAVGYLKGTCDLRGTSPPVTNLYPQDMFIFTSNFEVTNTKNTNLINNWDTSKAGMEFITKGTATSHTLSIPGEDNTKFGTNTFAWFSMDISGQTITLTDGSGSNGGAL